MDNRIIRTFTLPVVVLLMVFVAAPREAHAYIDPGTGSIILQALLAVLFGAILTLKLFWQKIKAAFLFVFSRTAKNEQVAEQGEVGPKS